MINYRTAVPSDVLDLITLVEEYCDETGFKHDMTSVKNYINFQLGKMPSIVAADGDIVAGVISFVIVPTPFCSTEIIGRKIACFVSKDYRDQGIGNNLIEAAENAAKQAGATKFYFTSPLSPNENYKPFETEFYRELLPSV